MSSTITICQKSPRFNPSQNYCSPCFLGYTQKWIKSQLFSILALVFFIHLAVVTKADTDLYLELSPIFNSTNLSSKSNVNSVGKRTESHSLYSTLPYLPSLSNTFESVQKPLTTQIKEHEFFFKNHPDNVKIINNHPKSKRYAALDSFANENSKNYNQNDYDEEDEDEDYDDEENDHSDNEDEFETKNESSGFSTTESYQSSMNEIDTELKKHNGFSVEPNKNNHDWNVNSHSIDSDSGSDSTTNYDGVLTNSVNIDNDASEENPLPSTLICAPNEFRCHSGEQCLPLSFLCDGRSHCLDFSDEINCHNSSTKEIAHTDKCQLDYEFECADSTCIGYKLRCNGDFDCPDGSDEASCHCQANQFRCKNQFECIETRFRCDRKYDCKDGTDELQCADNVCALGQFRCHSGQCIAERFKCNEIKECADGSDEIDCAKECRADEFRCLNKLQCIPRSLVCNQEYDCQDGSDEHKCIENHCPDNMFRCRDGQCVPKNARCDFNKDCFDGSDEFDCQMICGVNEFECHVDGRCISDSLRCDGFYDCFDFTDEQNCENRTCRLSQFRCGTGLCIDRALLCNGESDCPDRADEIECWLCRTGQYTCASGQCIEMEQRCDGRHDCEDHSDEVDCSRVEIILQVYPERQTIRQGQEAMFRCRDEGDMRVPVRWSREGNKPLPPGAIDLRGRLSLINVQTNYSGVYVCLAYDQNHESIWAQKAAYLTVQPTFDYEIMINHSPQNDNEASLSESDSTEINQNLGNCKNNEAQCSSGECILREYFCNGDFDCSDQSDELNCQCKPDQFQCDNGNCILKIYRCDSDDDCNDNSDEQSCDHENSNSTCKIDEYQCESGNQCVPKSFQCDGRFDCQDKSDEIGCSAPTIVENPVRILTVTEGETVKIGCRAIGIPIPLINWRKNGNHIPSPPKVTTTSVKGMGTLTIRDAVFSDQGTYSCEAINSRDSVQAVQETLLVVKPINLLCQSPEFNDLATDISECLRCFCFGVSDTCHSSSVKLYPIFTHDQKLKIVPMIREANGTFVDSSLQYPPHQEAIRFDEELSMYSVNSEAANLQTPDNVNFYWRLPKSFLGNQLMSYGSHLKYSIRYREAFSPSPLLIPDVIIRGNGITLYHYEKNFVRNPYGDTKIAVRFWTGEWHRDDRHAYREIPPLFEDTTREDIMIVLQNVEDILIKASYSYLLDSSILDIELESAQISNMTDPTRSAYIEQCNCAEGYIGSSCEQCAPGYVRQPAGRYLGRCNIAPPACQCNGHSDKCDPFTGQCIDCQDHTEGFNCERCQRGFYHNPKLNSDNKFWCTQCPCRQNSDQQLEDLEDEWEDIPEKWLVIPCRYDNLNQDVVCEICPIGYEGRLCNECARGFSRRVNRTGELICELKDTCAEDEFRCSNGTCIPHSYRCNQVLDCLPEGNDEFGCACTVNSFKCSDGNCIDSSLRCDGITNCLDNSDETNCYDGSLQCNSIGSLFPVDTDSNMCHCKSLVEGSLCDQCKPGSFYLNEQSEHGCIECFCFGVSDTCTKSFNLYRDYVEIKMDQYLHGIVVRDQSNSTNLSEELRFDHINRELIFNDFSNSNNLYWQLPFQFLGNKITSYGGNLNYTFRFQGNNFQKNSKTPYAILMGNNITLVYHYNDVLQPLVANTITISIFEGQWILEDGQPASRKDLMLVLSHLDTILLLASITNDINSVSLSAITLDTVVERYGNHYGYVRVDTVEECRCPTGYMGTSCERCAPGYKKTNLIHDNHMPFYGNGGKYFNCEPCFCNNHSDDCDPETGICINCQHYTTGPSCDQCLSGYHGNALEGTKFDCTLAQNISIDCYCDPRGTIDSDCQQDTALSQCNCKSTVEGAKCDTCKEGFFNLDANNIFGCLECFCFGVTDRCSRSAYYRNEINLNLLNILFSKSHQFELANRFKTHSYNDKILINMQNNELYFHSLFWIENSQYALTEDKPETLYWFLPFKFLGNRLTSYGGQLRYKQKYLIQTDGHYISDADVLLLGNGIMLQYINSETFPPNQEKWFSINISAEDASWQKIEHRTQLSGLASRVDFLRVLSGLEIIAIRATFHTQMKESFLKDVSLDESVPTNTGKEMAWSVEQCFCPQGYSGLSCEQCAPGYIRQSDHDGFFKCVRCQCHSHSLSCDIATGKCLHCNHNTTGHNCELCSQGFYGDATRGTSEDCQPCPCPFVSPNNNFSPTCFLDSDGEPTCKQCQNGYTGRKCEKCSPGFRGNPLVPDGRCEPVNSTQTIKVQIDGSKIRHVSAGSTVSLKCTADSQISQFAYNVVWTKLEGQLPIEASEASGVLTLPNIQPEHSGTYICTGFDLESVAQAQTTLVVKANMQVSVPKVRIEPHYQEVYLGDPVTFQCTAVGHPKPKLHWSIGHNKIINPSSSFSPETGIFSIPSAQKSDEAEYYCQATNSVGSDSVRTVLFVRDFHKYEYVHVNGVVPTARVFPPNYLAIKGENVRLECNVTGQPVPSVRWTFTGSGPDGHLPPNSREVSGVLILTNIETSNAGVYTCIASNSFGTSEAQVRLNVNLNQNIRPSVNVEPLRQTIVQGQTGELRCMSTGFPKPTITWQKIGDKIDPMRHKMLDDKLIIERMQMSDRGVYACRAENSEGVSQGSAIVDIELREIPSIEIYREASQIVPRGSNTYFQCRITGGIPKPSVEWRRMDGSRFSSHVEIRDGLLQFNEVSAQDEGVYVCTAENFAGRVTAQATLRIAGAPRIKIMQNTPYRVRSDEHVKLECQLMSLDFQQQNKVRLSWHRLKSESNLVNHTIYEVPRHPVNIFENRAILEFRSIKPNDNGIYACTAQSSGGGDAEEKIQVIVEDQNGKIIPDVYIEDKVVTVAAGSRAELRCFVRGTNRDVTIKWVRADNVSLPDMSRVENGTLTIDKVNPEDSGDYLCLGFIDSKGSQDPPRLLFKDRARLAVVAPPKIQINPPLQTVRPGDTAFIDCVAHDTSHSVTVDWSRIGGKLPTGVSTEVGNARLIILGVQETDAGRYLCTAVNAAGKSEAVGEIIVNDNEELTDSVPEEVTIVGSNLDLKCPSDLSETHNLQVTWKHQNSDLLPENVYQSDNELRISNVRLENAGLYTCSVSVAGTIVHQSSFGVKVKAIPTEIKLTPSKEVIGLGDDLELICSIKGDPMALVTWSRPYKNDVFSSNVQINGNILIVNQVQHDNGGVYRCTVHTYAGKYNADYVLVIQATSTMAPEIVETRTVAFGSQLYIGCPTALTQPVTYTWKKYRSSWTTDDFFSAEENLSQNSIIFSNGTLFIQQIVGNDAGAYVCIATNMASSEQVSMIIIVDGVVPRFLQKPLSYLSFPTLPDAYLSFELSLSVKPEKPNGLILYNGQDTNQGDFISLGLNNFYVEFRFQLGAGTTIIQSESPITLNQWHQIYISRNKIIGKLKVDKQSMITTSSKGKFIGLDLSEPLYIGGVPNFGEIAADSGFDQGFMGCISNLKIGSRSYELIKNSTYKQHISRCDTCFTSSCQNNGVCKENVLRPTGFECICPFGFSGSQCENTGDICRPGLCNGGKCIDQNFQKSHCLCPYGQTGQRCEQNISISEPLLANGAYLAFRPPTNSLTKLNFKIKIKPKFVSKHSSHLVLYTAQNINGSGDFIALALVNQTAKLLFDTGSGAVTISSPFVLSTDEWIDIVVTREGRQANLTVGDSQTVHGTSPGRTLGLTLLTPLYMGNYNKSKLSLPSSISSFSYFEGCIGQFEINGKNINLAKQHTESVNVEDCGSESPCQRIPCLNGGTCMELNKTVYSCTCPDKYTGTHCEQMKGPCEFDMPCLNRAECQNDGDNFICHCRLGYFGEVCSNKAHFYDTKTAKLNGRSFISFDSSYLTQSNQGFIQFKFQIKTYVASGLLLFYGQSSETQGLGKDFVAVAINQSKIEMSFELGSGLGQVFSDVFVDDGNTHSVVITLFEQKGTVEVDGEQFFGSSPGHLNALNANGDIYFAGVPNYDLMTGGRYQTGYSGCIGNIEIGISGVLDIVQSSKRSRNVLPCDNDVY